MLTIPINYTPIGGTYEVLTGAQQGAMVFGQDPLWLAWVRDLINLDAAGDTATYQSLLQNIVPARFKVGQMIGSSGILMGLTLAMFKNVDKDQRKAHKSMYVSAAMAVFLTGVTEPLEFMFMFAAMPLYAVYAVIQGAAFAMADIVNLRVHSFGNVELLTRTPLAIRAGLGMDLINFIWVTILFGVITYFIANFLIKKFNYATPGRNGNYEGGETESENGEPVDATQQVYDIIHLLGGKDNITDVDACMTRLRVSVANIDSVGDERAWKRAGAMGLVKKNKGVQAVYGPKADVLKSDIMDVLNSNAPIPGPKLKAEPEMKTTEETPVESAGSETSIQTVAAGEVISITEVNDAVFSEKMMGDGFAVNPSENEVVSPVNGKITNTFPTKHAIGIETDSGLEVLVHMGIDTVELKGEGFELFVKAGQVIKAGDKLAEMNLASVKEAGKETTIMVVFTNLTDKQSFDLTQSGNVAISTEVGRIN